MSGPAITYVPRPNATAEAELSTLANVYRFVLDRQARSPESRPGDAGKAQDPKRPSKTRREVAM